MDATVRAGIDLRGTVLRYAEVEQYGARYRLLRLGSCDFDFDVAHTLFRAGRPAHEEVSPQAARERLETVGRALGDVFKGSAASQLSVVLPPPACYSFFAAVPPDLQAEACRGRLHAEAALLAGGDAEELRLEAEPAHTEVLVGGERVAWYHVLAVPGPVQTRFDRVLRALPHATYRWRVSMQGAAQAAARLEGRAPVDGRAEEKPHTLVVGRYPSHAEYTLCRGRQWRFSYHAGVEAPADTAYFALALLDRLGVAPASVGRVFAYGQQAAPDALEHLAALLGLEPEPLNPLRLVDLNLDNLETRFDTSAYVPCIGIAL